MVSRWWRDPRAWAVAVPVVLVAGLAAWSLSPLGGERFVLETRGVDPPDPFRGDYARLAYGIATVSRSDPALDPGLDPRGGDRVYLELAPGPEEDPGGEAYWVVERVTAAKPSVAGGHACVRAEVTESDPSSFRVEMGIEAYFVQKDQDFGEWTGKEVSVVAVERGCVARIVEIRLDGVPWDG